MPNEIRPKEITERRDWRRMPAKDRITYVSQLIVLHPRFREAVRLLDRCHQGSRLGGEPVCGAILGASGVGKTSVVDHYCRLHPPEETETATRQPVLKVTLQPDARPKGIAAIGVDEIQWQRGHKYLTLAYQIDEDCRRLLWAGKDRTAKTLLRFFRMLGKERSARLRFVCSDMWKPYLKVFLRARFPDLNP